MSHHEVVNQSLGELISQHSTNLSRQILKLIFSFSAIGGGIAILSSLIDAATRPPLPPDFGRHFPLLSNPFNPVIDLLAFCVMVLVGIPFGIIFAASTLSTMLFYPKIEVYEEGLTHRTRTENKSVRWDELNILQVRLEEVKLWSTYHIGYIGDYRIYCDEQELLQISCDYHRIRDLHQILLFKTGELLWPQYANQFELGQIIAFGKNIRIHQRGLYYHKRFINWNNVIRCQLIENRLNLYDSYGRRMCVIRLHRTPNSHILLMLINTILSLRNKREHPQTQNLRSLPFHVWAK